MKKIVFLFIAICTVAILPAQENKNPYLFSYGADTVYKSEFERIYSKNNNKETPDEKTIREYLELYINFKMKVKEARMNGLDTSAAFINELEGYKKQLGQSYLVDKRVTNQLIQEAYERMKWEINASHILLACDENALPKDTIAVYNRIMDLRKRAMKGESFDSLAYNFSDGDPTAKRNLGNLGWFSVFQMIYSFETAAYTTKPGEISMPIRTRFGYHIVKVNDRRPSRGEIKVAHIMVRKPTNPTGEQLLEVKNKIDAIYAKAKAGEAFESLVKQYSEDEGSNNSGGVINYFSSTSNLPSEFKDAAFALQKNGDISEPVQTVYGFHILKRLDKKDVAPLTEVEETIKQKISRDSRAEVNKIAVIDRVKKENKFTENQKAINEFLKTADSSLLQGRWSSGRASKLYNTLFTLGGQKYTQQDFAKYVENFQTPKQTGKAEGIMLSMYRDFVNTSVMKFEEDHLEAKYEEFKNVMQEYRDGILLFDLTDKKVWSKAVTDTIGLKDFYERNKANYMWQERAVASIYDCANQKVAKDVKKLLKKGKSSQEIIKAMNEKDALNVVFKEGKYEKGENKLIDSLSAKTGTYEMLMPDGKVKIVIVKEKLPAQVKALTEAKGMITADYQAYLEKEWHSELRKKYPVKVNESTIQMLFK